ncbi:hypothetical protein Gpo141_00010957 [Globisporangium polare]
MVARRTLKAEQLRRDTRRRLDVTTVLGTSHKSTQVGKPTTPDPATLFGSEPQCFLEPQVIEGLYYISGELLRMDIREKQAGVEFYADLQFIDVNTCQPVPELYIDFWHCNSTGVYSGVVADGNGNAQDKRNVDTTVSRGLAPTDTSGVVSFVTKFPGHYTGRAHPHPGHIFFDQSLVNEIVRTPVYAANKQPLTINKDDDIFVESAATAFDPVMEYMLLGESVEDVVFTWLSIGVDMTAALSVEPVSALTASIAATSGVATTSNSGSGSGGAAVHYVKRTPTPSPGSSAAKAGSVSGSSAVGDSGEAKQSASPGVSSATAFVGAVVLVIASACLSM